MKKLLGRILLLGVIIAFSVYNLLIFNEVLSKPIIMLLTSVITIFGVLGVIDIIKIIKYINSNRIDTEINVVKERISVREVYIKSLKEGDKEPIFLKHLKKLQKRNRLDKRYLKKLRKKKTVNK